MKINYKIFAGFLTIILFFIGIAYFFVYPKLMSDYYENLEESLKNDKKFISTSIKENIETRKSESGIISSDANLIELYAKYFRGDKVTKFKFLKISEKKKRDIYGGARGSKNITLVLTDNKGNVLGKNYGVYKWQSDLEIMDMYKIIPEEKGSNYQVSEAGLFYDKEYVAIKSMTSINYHNASANKYMGIVMLIDPIHYDYIDKLKSDLGVEIILKTPNGKIISTLYDKAFKRMNTIDIKKEMKELDLDGKKYYVDYITLQDFWNNEVGTVFVLKSIDEFINRKNKLINNLIWILLASFVLAIVLSSLLSLAIVEPLDKLKIYIENMADGNLEFKVSTRLTKRTDELGFFAKSFEKMKNEFLMNQEKIKYYNKELETSYKEMKNYLYIFEIKNKELTERVKEQEIIKEILNKGIKEVNEVNVFLKFLLKRFSEYKTYKRAELVYKNTIDNTYETIVYLPDQDKYLESFYSENLKYLLNDRMIKKDGYIELPISLRNELAGNIKFEGIDLNDNSEKVLNILINELEIILENAELYYKMDKKIIELSFLNSISVAISSVKNITAMKKVIGDSVAVLFGASDSDMYLYEKGYFKSFEEIEGEVLKENILEVKDENMYILNKFENIKINKDYYVPLVVKEKLVGAIRFEQAINFRNLDKNIIKIFLSQISVVMQNNLMYAENKRRNFTIIKSLAQAIDEKDEYTRGHSERVMSYAIKIAEEMKMDYDYVEKIKYAGILHDVGKIGIPESILLKPGKLTEEEYAVIKEHPTKGAKILSHIEALKDVADIVKYHHERPDGKGYPMGLKAEEIPIGAKILAIADTFDAMTSDRPYRKGLEIENVVEEIELNIGKQFDIKISELVLDMIKNKRLKIEK